MRIAVFFLYLFFQLLGFGNFVHAASHASSHEINSFVSSCKKVQFSQSGPNTFSITTAEFDLEEELSSSENFKNSGTSVSYTKDFLTQAWYMRYSCASEKYHFDKKIIIFTPSFGQSTPIYIIQQVLRI